MVSDEFAVRVAQNLHHFESRCLVHDLCQSQEPGADLQPRLLRGQGVDLKANPIVGPEEIRRSPSPRKTFLIGHCKDAHSVEYGDGIRMGPLEFAAYEEDVAADRFRKIGRPTNHDRTIRNGFA